MMNLSLLHPDLLPHVVRTDEGYGLCCPMLTVRKIETESDYGSVPWINEYYSRNKAHADQLVLERKWDRYIFFTQRHFRIHAFHTIQSHLSDVEYWSLLNEIWTDAETIWRNNAEWLLALNARPATRHLFMSAEDRLAYTALPSRMTIYRGYQPRKNAHGFSWTLRRDIAERLSNNGKGANLFDYNFALTGGKVRKKVVVKSDIYAYTNGREEEEVILLWNGARYLTPTPLQLCD